MNFRDVLTSETKVSVKKTIMVRNEKLSIILLEPRETSKYDGMGLCE